MVMKITAFVLSMVLLLPGSIPVRAEVNSFSDAALDHALFEAPAGFTRIQANPAQIITNTPKH
jgi:hypothetical protein